MSYQSVQNADSPLSRWQFEELSGTTIDDDLTVTRDGTINGGITLGAAAVFTDSGLGAIFNGTTGYVSMGNMSGLLGLGTVEAVVQFSSIPAGPANPIFSHAYSGGQVIPLVIGFNIDAGHSGLLQVGYFTGSVWQTATWTTAPAINTPYHIVGTYDGTNLTLFINATQVATSSPVTARPGAGVVHGTAYIGKRWDLNQFHNGTVWDVALYGTALNSTSVIQHFTALANPFTDNFANAGQLVSGMVLAGIDSTVWTTEGSEPGGLSHTGWATFTPSTTNSYMLSSVGSDYDTVINVYTGASLGALSLVGSDDNSGGSGTARIQMTLTSGTQYYVQVGAQAAGSGGNLSFSFFQASFARLATNYVETLAANQLTTATRLATLYSEAIVTNQTTTQTRLATVYLEVITPSVPAFIGWGLPI